MPLETGLALVAGLMLLLAFAVQVLPFAWAVGRRRVVVPAARTAAASFLTAALLAGVAEGGNWTSPGPRQLALGLTLATLLVQAFLGWRAGTGSAGPASDLVCLALVLLASSILPHTQLASCAPRPAALYAQWILHLLGAGGAVVAGSAASMLILRTRLRRPGESPRAPPQIATQTYLQQGAGLTLILLGAGLICSAWLAGQEVGHLIGSDPRQVWMAIAWLLAAAGLLAWRLEMQSSRRAEAWAVTLALLAASAAVFGLVILNGLGPSVGL